MFTTRRTYYMMSGCIVMALLWGLVCWRLFDEVITQSILSHTTGLTAQLNSIRAGWASLTTKTNVAVCSIGTASFCALLLRSPLSL